LVSEKCSTAEISVSEVGGKSLIIISFFLGKIQSGNRESSAVNKEASEYRPLTIGG
jgi:hypothetical protein